MTVFAVMPQPLHTHLGILPEGDEMPYFQVVGKVFDWQLRDTMCDAYSNENGASMPD